MGDEAKLLGRASRGDREAWESFLAAHGGFALGLALQRLSRAGFGHAEAEEVVQEAWIGLLRAGGPGRIDPGRDPRAYLVAAVLNAARAWLRARGRRQARESLAPMPPSPEAPEEPLLRAESREKLELALARLEPGDQLLLRWVYWEGLSYAQVARLRGVEANSVGSLLGRVRSRLREALEEGEAD